MVIKKRGVVTTTFTQPSGTELRTQKQTRVCAAAGAITVQEPGETSVPSVDGQVSSICESGDRTSHRSAKAD